MATSLSAGRVRLAGSLTAMAPGGMVMEGWPEKVRALAEARRISEEDGLLRAMCAAAMVSGSVPNSFERTMRTREPPSETWTIWRRVTSAGA